MLTPGNRKLGADLIWGFGLPSGRSKICVGMTPTCRRHCYAIRTEQYRLRAAERYAANFALTRRKSFVRRIRAFLIAHHVRVVRIHSHGEFYSARYARKWLRIIQRSPRVRFFTYTRAWRVPAIAIVLEAITGQPNCQVWYSLDKETGWPGAIPHSVRLAWLMTSVDDYPASPVDLVFRVQSLRSQPLKHLDGNPVCRAEAGDSDRHVTCDHCRLCWKPPEAFPTGRRIPLALVT